METLSSGVLSVNNHLHKKGDKAILRNGDEITISGSKSHTYVLHSLAVLTFWRFFNPGANQHQIIPHHGLKRT